MLPLLSVEATAFQIRRVDRCTQQFGRRKLWSDAIGVATPRRLKRSWRALVDSHPPPPHTVSIIGTIVYRHFPPKVSGFALLSCIRSDCRQDAFLSDVSSYERHNSPDVPEQTEVRETTSVAWLYMLHSIWRLFEAHGCGLYTSLPTTPTSKTPIKVFQPSSVPHLPMYVVLQDT